MPANNKDMNPQAGIAGTSALYKFNSSPNTRAVVSQKCRILTPAYGSTDGLLYQIGVVASFSISGSSRGAEPYRGVGFGDQIAELVPGVSDPHSASFTRTLLYLSNAHQAFGFAGGVDGPVRTLQHHRWPFDIEQQLVFSTLADTEAPTTSPNGLVDVDFTSQNASNGELNLFQNIAEAAGDAGTAPGKAGSNKHKALITYCEGCWITSMDHGEMSADGGIIQQNIEAQITDVHDLYSTYGEFMATGNDPTLGQNSSLLYNERAATATGRSAGASASGVAPAPEAPA
jgi:hypothetical protein